MPYYAWKGVTLDGSIKRGSMSAASTDALDQGLFKQDIALLESREQSYSWFAPSIKARDVLMLLKQLIRLLRANFLLPDALSLLCEHMQHTRLQGILVLITDDVYKGSSLSDAMSRYLHIFDSTIVQAIKIGQETGNLTVALNHVCQALEKRENFRKQLRMAALMPAMTFSFLMIMVYALFVGIVPHFISILSATDRALPQTTAVMMRVSEFLCSYQCYYLLFFLMVAVTVAMLFLRSQKGKVYSDVLILKIPFLHAIVRKNTLIHFLRSLALLQEGSVPLVQSLTIAQKSVKNSVLYHEYHYLASMVQAGHSLSESMRLHPHHFFNELMVATIYVGEQAGQLSGVLAQLADDYQEEVARLLARYALLFQPLCMILLGLLVALLIFAVYMPIFDMAHVAY